MMVMGRRKKRKTNSVRVYRKKRKTMTMGRRKKRKTNSVRVYRKKRKTNSVRI